MRASEIRAGMKAADLELPEDNWELQCLMAETVPWRISRRRLAFILLDATNADGPGMASRGEVAIRELRRLWADRRVTRCCDCGAAAHQDERLFEGRCGRCSWLAEEALERLQDRQIARFERY